MSLLLFKKTKMENFMKRTPTFARLNSSDDPSDRELPDSRSAPKEVQPINQS
jgi:hypothetical protein